MSCRNAEIKALDIQKMMNNGSLLKKGIGRRIGCMLTKDYLSTLTKLFSSSKCLFIMSDCLLGLCVLNGLEMTN